jgi:hypothetical protein
MDKYQKPLQTANVPGLFGVFDGCRPEVARAIGRVYRDWAPYSNKGGRYRLAALFNEHVAPAWLRYLQSIPGNSRAGKLLNSIHLICPRGPRGFRTLENVFVTLCRFTVGDPSVTDSMRVELNATQNSVISLLQSCQAKHPLSHGFGDVTRRKFACHEFCKFCGENTELFAAWSLPQNRRNAMSGLSGEFCKKHKKIKDGRQNPAYQRAYRNHERFSSVLRSLNAQYQRQTYQRRKTSGPIPSNFYSLVAADLDPSKLEFSPICFPDGYIVEDPDFEEWEYMDVSQIRNAARRIVDAGITEAWMKVIVLLHANRDSNQSEIAEKLGMSRQQLWGIVNSKKFQAIPKAFRFDKRRRAG